MNELLALLRQALNNPAAEFRPGQEEAILSVLTPPRRSLVVQATGWGKSMVYFVASKALRIQGSGPTLVVSPLLSLMRDQLRATENLGLRARVWSSENQDEWDDIIAELTDDEVDLMFISPERLANEAFQQAIQSTSIARAGLVVIDEAHCISDWGHDFRPDYQRIVSLVRRLPPTTAVLATTATANDRVVEDVLGQIGSETRLLKGSLARESLRLQTIPKFNSAQRLAWLGDHLDHLPGSGIIYTLTTRDAERVADWLKSQGHNVEAYHSRIGRNNEERPKRRAELEAALLQNKVKALAATVALGMGFDKPDLGFVVHFQSPGNLVAYYQQIGRAGRAIPEAVAILFLGEEDDRIHEWFIDRARPDEGEMRMVLDVLAEADVGLTIYKILESVNLTYGEIDQVLSVLSIESPPPVRKDGSKWIKTPYPYTPDLERERKLKEQRTAERQRFVEFAQSDECMMKLVRLELNDSTAASCGKCANCIGKPIVSLDIQEERLNAAQSFLNRSHLAIEPRRRWGDGTKIAESDRIEPGLCLSTWGDPGVAQTVATDKQTGDYRQKIVLYSANVLQRFFPGLPFDYVCAVPSLRNTRLVPDFAQRLAKELGQPYRPILAKVRETEEQKRQRNSYHQWKNLEGAFRITGDASGRALLVDDAVDSRWTFTHIGALLRRAGAESVTPFALVSTQSSND